MKKITNFEDVLIINSFTMTWCTQYTSSMNSAAENQSDTIRNHSFKRKVIQVFEI